MNIHEYQAKALFRKYGIPVPEGYPAFDLEEAEAVLDEHFPDGRAVLKAQVHSGGRGKAGGILLGDSKEDALEKAGKLFGMKLVTRQTGPEGKTVRKIYIERPSVIDEELYLSLLVDTGCARHVFIACREGGTSIEELAEREPEKIIRVCIDPEKGFTQEDGKKIAAALGQDEGKIIQAAQHMYEMFTSEDCTLIEINPLAVNRGELTALDAKVILDSDAMFRHKENLALQDESEEDPLELEAARYGMNYVSLSGDIGCICNGAGLGMSTMDAISHYGGRPANFMDTGGTVTVEKAAAAYEIVAGCGKVRGIIVNIFGGIARTDLIAEGLVQGMRNIRKPVVVRIDGNSAEKAREILTASGLPVVMADNCSDAVRKMMDLLKGEEQ
ncbi:MAG: ADP-forming succinate--CoA ligase subunit beta [Solobacterium sp.]|nr:ADP-forming succinate--CoA ligase subunit beta [Solobacterium sp.]